MLAERVLTKDAFEKKEVVVAGWVEEFRDLKKIKFIILRDFSGTLQITLPKAKVKPEVFDIELTKESVIAVKGTMVDSKDARGGKELIPEQIEVLSTAESPLPIDISGKIETDLSKRLDWRTIDLRQPKNAAIFKIESELLKGFSDYLNSKGFIQVFTPSLMGVPSESGSDVFEVKYFDRKAFLRQDPQLHRQLTILGGIEKIYDIGPSWRAEQSNTVRHLTEHRTCAAEFAFIKNEYDVMEVEEALVVAGLKRIKEHCKKELELLGKDFEMPKTPFPVLEFPHIYKILEKHGKKIKEGEDYDSESEKILADYVKKEHGSDFFFVNKVPFAVKPFYVMRDNSSKWARSTDLIFKGIEQSSGGQREHRYDELLKNVEEKGIKNVSWFTDHFKYGAPPHGGFSIGIERFVMQLLDLPNIRESTLFPRDPIRLTP